MTSITGLPNSSLGFAEPKPVSRRRAVFGWAGLFFAVLLLYGMTASRTIGWQDSGDFVNRVVRGWSTDPCGLCRAHPLHFWLGTSLVKDLRKRR